MRAVVCDRYGAPQVLRVSDEEPTPVPKDDEVLVDVRAASVNSWDWDLLCGKAMIIRMVAPRKPPHRVLGADIAGRVESVGAKVTFFKPGDDVFGDISSCGFGGYAERVCVPERCLANMPRTLSYADAASIPQAGVLALQSLRYRRQVGPGDHVLLNGAGGGVGTFALQLAKLWGAHVTAIDHGDKGDMLRAMGADQVFDYTRDHPFSAGTGYDRIVDVVGNRSVMALRRALNPSGIHVMVGGPLLRILEMLLLGSLISRIQNRKMGILMHRPNRTDLDDLARLCELKKLKPVVDRCFSMTDVGEAFRYFGAGKVQGKVVIKIAD